MKCSKFYSSFHWLCLTERVKVREEASEAPIKLLDPPKSKLKRQLSIDTAERTDALHARKRVLLYDSDSPRSRTDEVDGGRPSNSANSEIIKVETSRSFSADDYDRRRVTVATDVSGCGIAQTFVPEIVYDNQDLQRDYPSTSDYPSIPLQSPNRFNLSDIGLTSPFASRNPIGTHAKETEKEVFVFPDSVPPRKLSPYKPVHDECRTRDVKETGDERSREIFSRRAHESLYRDEIGNEAGLKHTETKDSAHTKYSSCHKEQYRKGYVSESGFSWPEKVTITEPVTFSPRIVTVDSRPRFPSTSTSVERNKKTREDEELKTRLAILEREYARAKEIFDPVPHDYRQLSPTTRNVENLRRAALRSISNKDRSPNEKDIRETNEEVRNRYERSFSDPRFSPRQLHSLIMRPSPLSRQQEGSVHDSLVCMFYEYVLSSKS